MDRINRSSIARELGRVHGAARFSPLYHVDLYEPPYSVPIQLSYPDRQCQREVFSNGGSIYRGVIFCSRAVCSFVCALKRTETSKYIRNIEIDSDNKDFLQKKRHDGKKIGSFIIVVFFYVVLAVLKDLLYK